MGSTREKKVTDGDVAARLSYGRRRAAMLNLLPADVRERLSPGDDRREAECDFVESLSRGRR